MEGIDLNQLMTQESDCEIFASKRPSKVPAKKTSRCIVDFVHLSSLANSYNHHFVLYSWNTKNVTHLIPIHVWKVVYVDYKLVP
jgi:hypothetical protein